jgi:hypothetical protein
MELVGRFRHRHIGDRRVHLGPNSRQAICPECPDLILSLIGHMERAIPLDDHKPHAGEVNGRIVSGLQAVGRCSDNAGNLHGVAFHFVQTLSTPKHCQQKSFDLIRRNSDDPPAFGSASGRIAMRRNVPAICPATVLNPNASLICSPSL